MNNPFEQLQKQLADLQRQIASTPTDNAPEWLSADQAADYLNIKKSTLYKKTMNGELPFYKPGKKLRFKRTELSEFIQSGRQTPPRYEGITIEG